MKHCRLIIGSIVAIATGSILWTFIGPAVVLIGIPTPKDHEWSFFKAYGWLSGSPPISEISSTYWLGFTIIIIGFSMSIAGVIGIILALTRTLLSKPKTNLKQRVLD